MPRILLTHAPDMLANYYGPGALEALRKLGEVRLNPAGELLSTPALIEAARGCDIVVSDRQTPAQAQFFEQAADVVAFLRCAVDIRNIDVDAASRQGILVTRATAGFMASVAELAIGFMIDLSRHVSAAVLDYRAGREAEVRRGRQLAGSVLGIIGFGAIGVHLAQLGKALGMTVMATDPHRRIDDAGVTQVALDRLLNESDFVVCLAVATPETRHLMNAAAFARMKPSAYFINLARSSLVDEAALASALDTGRIAGAAMDVGSALDEKPPLDLARRSDVVATPHIGGLTPQSIEHQAFDTVRQVGQLIAGNVPPEAVNADRANRLDRLRGR